MAEEKLNKKKLKLFKKDTNRKNKQKDQDLISQLKISYRSLEDIKKFYKSILIPSIILSVLIFSLPFIFNQIIVIDIEFNQITFIVGGIIPLVLGLFYPLMKWKNRE